MHTIRRSPPSPVLRSQPEEVGVSNGAGMTRGRLNAVRVYPKFALKNAIVRCQASLAWSALWRGLEALPHGVVAPVILGVLDEQRRLDAVDSGFRCGAVKRHGGVQVSTHLDGEVVHRAAAPAEPGGTELAVRQGMGFQEPGRVEEIDVQLAAVEAALQLLAIVVIAGIARRPGPARRAPARETRRLRRAARHPRYAG